MAADTSDNPPRIAAVAERTIAAFGLDPQEFFVDEDRLPPELGADRVVTVRRLTTGDERLYVAGEYSPWLWQLTDDLRAGRFH